MNREIRHLHQITADLERFKEWLVARNAEVLTPTNIYEVVRFRTPRGLSVLYKDKTERLTWTGESEEAYLYFLQNLTNWRGNEPARRPDANRRRGVMLTIIDRDGTECFYCGYPVPIGEETLEHLFSVAFGGKTHLANLVLADEKCNRKAGNLTVVEKVRLRDLIRAESARGLAAAAGKDSNAS